MGKKSRELKDLLKAILIVGARAEELFIIHLISVKI